MIVKDEASNLPRCLNSVKAIATEMIVVDTGSTDRTPQIARALGAEVYHCQWTHNFSAARNESLKYATEDWILVLDADEELRPEVIPCIQEAMAQPDVLVINLLRQEIGATQSPYSLMSRLFRNHMQIRFSRPYHAMVDDSVSRLLQRESHWRILNLPDVAIAHYGYEPGTIAARNKLEKAKTTMEEYLSVHPDDAYVCSKLGALYVQIGAFKQGVELLERGLKNQPEPPIAFELHYHLGIAQTRLRNLPQATKHYRQAVEQPVLGTLKLGAYSNLASVLKTRGDLIGAKAFYEIAISIDPHFAVGHYNLAMLLKEQKRWTDAVTHYQQAITINPDYAEAHQNLGVVLLKLGRVPESMQSFRTAIVIYTHHNPQEAFRLRRGLQEMGFQL
jgi:tetratricopeptide (TPR) repeat protein